MVAQRIPARIEPQQLRREKRRVRQHLLEVVERIVVIADHRERERDIFTDGCRVEPDGICPHGHKSWLLELGYI